jgi:hypothetical protein
MFELRVIKLFQRYNTDIGIKKFSLIRSRNSVVSDTFDKFVPALLYQLKKRSHTTHIVSRMLEPERVGSATNLVATYCP